MEETRPGFGLRLRHGCEYAAVSAVSAVVKLLPRPWALGVGAAIGQIGWWTGIRRSKVLAHISHAMPDAGSAEQRRTAARAARNFGRTVTEFLRFSGRDRQRVLDLVQIEGLEVVHEALARGRGAVLVTGHLGAWALYVTALGAAGIASALLVGVQRNARVNELILGIPGDAVQFISKSKSAPREILRALRQNKVIVMVADHYSSEQRVFVPFLGKKAFTLPLPGALVAKHRIPLLCMAGHRVADGTHRLRITSIPVPDDLEGDALRLEVAVRCNQALGEAIRRCPEQYFWYHDRWKVRSKIEPRLTAEVEESAAATQKST